MKHLPQDPLSLPTQHPTARLHITPLHKTSLISKPSFKFKAIKIIGTYKTVYTRINFPKLLRWKDGLAGKMLDV